MDVTTAVKVLLSMTGKKQLDLGKQFEMSPQSFSNKVREQRWSASDLIKVAEFTGSMLAFVLPNGETLILTGPPMGEGKSDLQKS